MTMDTPLTVRPWRRYRTPALLLALVLLALMGLRAFEGSDLTLSADAVQIAEVRRGDLIRTVRGSGRLVPETVRILAAETAGRVERIEVQAGGRLEAGQALLVLDNPDVLDAALAAQSELAAARAERSARETELRNGVLTQRATVAEALANWQATQAQVAAEQKLQALGAISAIQLEQTRFRAAHQEQRLVLERERESNMAGNIEVQLSALDARLELLAGKARLAAERRDALTVRASLAGVLQSIAVGEGQSVAAGTELAQIVGQGGLRARVQVPESAAGGLYPGLTVALSSSVGDLDGTVIQVDPQVRDSAVAVDIRLAEQREGMRPEMSVEATFTLEDIPDVLVLARPASLAGDRARVYVLADGGLAQARDIRVGRRSVTEVEVIEGLQAGERVIVSAIPDADLIQTLRLK